MQIRANVQRESKQTEKPTELQLTNKTPQNSSSPRLQDLLPEFCFRRRTHGTVRCDAAPREPEAWAVVVRVKDLEVNFPWGTGKPRQALEQEDGLSGQLVNGLDRCLASPLLDVALREDPTNHGVEAVPCPSTPAPSPCWPLSKQHPLAPRGSPQRLPKATASMNPDLRSSTRINPFLYTV